MMRGSLAAVLVFLSWQSASAGASQFKGRLLAEGGAAADFEGYVVWIDQSPKPSGGQAEGASQLHVMSQVAKDFSPRVLAVRTGDKVSFENLDNVFHNVFSLDKRNPFDLGLYKGKKHFAPDLRTELRDSGSIVKSFPAEGKFQVFCNIHPDMVGTIYAFSHPHYALADKNGLFTLAVPAPGEYTVVADGPRLEEPVKTKVKVAAGGALVAVKLKLAEAPRKIAHTKKDGSSYRTRAN